MNPVHDMLSPPPQRETRVYRFGEIEIRPVVCEGFLASLGEILIKGIPVRSGAVRFLPWFDTLEGDQFRQFRLESVEADDHRIVFHTTALSDPDVVFRGERDSSGDPVFRNESWDTPPKEVPFRIFFEATSGEVEGHQMAGFRYGFEFESGDVDLYRILDRQTWELGGHLSDLRVCIRNWSHKPMVELSEEEAFSTGGLVESFAVAFPGNLWARWSMMPAFDFQYRPGQGALIGWFDEVSLVRNLVESSKGENWLRCLDLHGFAKTRSGKTNAKTVMLCTEGVEDDVDAVNLWTRMYDREQKRSRADLGIRQDEHPPYLMISENAWVGFHPDRSYETALATTAEFDMDYLFIDPVWENEQTVHEMTQEKFADDPENELHRFFISNMCATLRYRVSKYRGGEEAYRNLVKRAEAQGVKVITWGACHLSSRAQYFGGRRQDLLVPNGFATKESGRHPDTGYPLDVWVANLRTKLKEVITKDLHESLEATGLAGFLWDSFSNMGWWQIDYGDGTLAPQFREMAELFASFVNKGYYIRPEALVSFSNHSGLGMAAENLYPPGLMSTYSYNTEIGFGDKLELGIVRGTEPVDLVFHWLANRHAPSFHFHRVPEEERDPEAMKSIKRWIALYKANRHDMIHRTVQKDCAGILWEGNGKHHLWVLKEQSAPPEGAVDHESGERPDVLQPLRVYNLGAKA